MSCRAPAFVFLLLTATAAAWAESNEFLNASACRPAGAESGPSLFAALERAMRTVLEEGNVADRGMAYRKLGESPAWITYQSLVGCLRESGPGERQSREEALSFWINLYNALVVHGVLESGIPPSVTRVPDFFTRTAYRIDGARLNLDEIEHGILRGNRPKEPGASPLLPPQDSRLRYALGTLEPRIHFALVCGARSCPPVRAFRAEGLDAQLEETARDYLNASVRVGPDGRTLQVPMILSWFEADFGGRRGVFDLLRRLLAPGPARKVLDSIPPPDLSYTPFDWRLNDAL